jgi:hypothetical protein
VSAPEPSLREVLKALHDSDRRHAPPFECLTGPTQKASARRQPWWPAAAAIVATAVGLALWLRSPGTTDASPQAWSDWRSPTAALLFEGSGVAGADRFVSPTRALSPPQLPSGDVR